MPNEIGFTLFTAHEESCVTAATGKLLALSSLELAYKRGYTWGRLRLGSD